MSNYKKVDNGDYIRKSNKTMKKISMYLDVIDTPIYNQMKDNDVNFLLKDNFILKFLDDKVKTGEMCKISNENLPYIYSYKPEDMVRRLKIQKMITESNVKMVDMNTMYYNGNNYKSMIFETGIIKKCSSNVEPVLTNSDLVSIIEFCKESNITHIYRIIEKRVGISINKSDMSMNNIFDIKSFKEYGIDITNIKHKVYYNIDNDYYDECCIDKPSSVEYDYNNSVILENISDSYYDINSNIYFPENEILDCYLFNEVSYSIRGYKTYDKDIIDEFNRCKVDIDYFTKKYIKK